VGFVGRVVPIKDVISFIQACNLAMADVVLDVRIIGPIGEDPAYVRRCVTLVETLGLTSSVVFTGPQPAHLIYSDLDVVVLTSFSEGQPLVILEAYAAGLPVIATDVGACREMIEGRSAPDRLLGGSGIVTRVGTASETAAALVRLARDPALRRRLGLAGRKRVVGFYRRQDMIESYRGLYREMVSQ
jgi:glycosyltransferase involved in cell wall biosynthesis